MLFLPFSHCIYNIYWNVCVFKMSPHKKRHDRIMCTGSAPPALCIMWSAVYTAKAPGGRREKRLRSFQKFHLRSFTKSPATWRVCLVRRKKTSLIQRRPTGTKWRKRRTEERRKSCSRLCSQKIPLPRKRDHLDLNFLSLGLTLRQAAERPVRQPDC